MSFIVALLVLLGIFVVTLIGLWLRVYGIKSFKQNMRESIFLFKWFLINKYHCRVSGKAKIFLLGLNRLFWGVIIVAIALLIADIIQFLGVK